MDGKGPVIVNGVTVNNAAFEYSSLTPDIMPVDAATVAPEAQDLREAKREEDVIQIQQEMNGMVEYNQQQTSHSQQTAHHHEHKQSNELEVRNEELENSVTFDPRLKGFTIIIIAKAAETVTARERAFLANQNEELFTNSKKNSKKAKSEIESRLEVMQIAMAKLLSSKEIDSVTKNLQKAAQLKESVEQAITETQKEIRESQSTGFAKLRQDTETVEAVQEQQEKIELTAEEIQQLEQKIDALAKIMLEIDRMSQEMVDKDMSLEERQAQEQRDLNALAEINKEIFSLMYVTAEEAQAMGVQLHQSLISQLEENNQNLNILQLAYYNALSARVDDKIQQEQAKVQQEAAETLSLKLSELLSEVSLSQKDRIAAEKKRGQTAFELLQGAAYALQQEKNQVINNKAAVDAIQQKTGKEFQEIVELAYQARMISENQRETVLALYKNKEEQYNIAADREKTLDEIRELIAAQNKLIAERKQPEEIAKVDKEIETKISLYLLDQKTKAERASSLKSINEAFAQLQYRRLDIKPMEAMERAELAKIALQNITAKYEQKGSSPRDLNIAQIVSIARHLPSQDVAKINFDKIINLHNDYFLGSYAGQHKRELLEKALKGQTISNDELFSQIQMDVVDIEVQLKRHELRVFTQNEQLRVPLFKEKSEIVGFKHDLEAALARIKSENQDLLSLYTTIDGKPIDLMSFMAINVERQVSIVEEETILKIAKNITQAEALSPQAQITRQREAELQKVMQSYFKQQQEDRREFIQKQINDNKKWWQESAKIDLGKIDVALAKIKEKSGTFYANAEMSQEIYDLLVELPPHLRVLVEQKYRSEKGKDISAIFSDKDHKKRVDHILNNNITLAQVHDAYINKSDPERIRAIYQRRPDERVSEYRQRIENFESVYRREYKTTPLEGLKKPLKGDYDRFVAAIQMNYQADIVKDGLVAINQGIEESKVKKLLQYSMMSISFDRGTTYRREYREYRDTTQVLAAQLVELKEQNPEQWKAYQRHYKETPADTFRRTFDVKKGEPLDALLTDLNSNLGLPQEQYSFDEKKAALVLALLNEHHTTDEKLAAAEKLLANKSFRETLVNTLQNSKYDKNPLLPFELLESDYTRFIVALKKELKADPKDQSKVDPKQSLYSNQSIIGVKIAASLLEGKEYSLAEKLCMARKSHITDKGDSFIMDREGFYSLLLANQTDADSLHRAKKEFKELTGISLEDEIKTDTAWWSSSTIDSRYVVAVLEKIKGSSEAEVKYQTYVEVRRIASKGALGYMEWSYGTGATPNMKKYSAEIDTLHSEIIELRRQSILEQGKDEKARSKSESAYSKEIALKEKQLSETVDLYINSAEMRMAMNERVAEGAILPVEIAAWLGAAYVTKGQSVYTQVTAMASASTVSRVGTRTVLQGQYSFEKHGFQDFVVAPVSTAAFVGVAHGVEKIVGKYVNQAAMQALKARGKLSIEREGFSEFTKLVKSGVSPEQAQIMVEGTGKAGILTRWGTSLKANALAATTRGAIPGYVAGSTSGTMNHLSQGDGIITSVAEGQKEGAASFVAAGLLYVPLVKTIEGGSAGFRKVSGAFGGKGRAATKANIEVQNHVMKEFGEAKLEAVTAQREVVEKQLREAIVQLEKSGKAGFDKEALLKLHEYRALRSLEVSKSINEMNLREALSKMTRPVEVATEVRQAPKPKVEEKRLTAEEIKSESVEDLSKRRSEINAERERILERGKGGVGNAYADRFAKLSSDERVVNEVLNGRLNKLSPEGKFDQLLIPENLVAVDKITIEVKGSKGFEILELNLTGVQNKAAHIREALAARGEVSPVRYNVEMNTSTVRYAEMNKMIDQRVKSEYSPKEIKDVETEISRLETVQKTYQQNRSELSPLEKTHEENLAREIKELRDIVTAKRSAQNIKKAFDQASETIDRVYQSIKKAPQVEKIPEVKVPEVKAKTDAEIKTEYGKLSPKEIIAERSKVAERQAQLTNDRPVDSLSKSEALELQTLARQHRALNQMADARFQKLSIDKNFEQLLTAENLASIDKITIEIQGANSSNVLELNLTGVSDKAAHIKQALSNFNRNSSQIRYIVEANGAEQARVLRDLGKRIQSESVTMEIEQMNTRINELDALHKPYTVNETKLSPLEEIQAARYARERDDLIMMRAYKSATQRVDNAFKQINEQVTKAEEFVKDKTKQFVREVTRKPQTTKPVEVEAQVVRNEAPVVEAKVEAQRVEAVKPVEVSVQEAPKTSPVAEAKPQVTKPVEVQVQKEAPVIETEIKPQVVETSKPVETVKPQENKPVEVKTQVRNEAPVVETEIKPQSVAAHTEIRAEFPPVEAKITESGIEIPQVSGEEWKTVGKLMNHYGEKINGLVVKPLQQGKAYLSEISTVEQMVDKFKFLSDAFTVKFEGNLNVPRARAQVDAPPTEVRTSQGRNNGGGESSPLSNGWKPGPDINGGDGGLHVGTQTGRPSAPQQTITTARPVIEQAPIRPTETITSGNTALEARLGESSNLVVETTTVRPTMQTQVKPTVEIEPARIVEVEVQPRLQPARETRVEPAPQRVTTIEKPIINNDPLGLNNVFRKIERPADLTSAITDTPVRPQTPPRRQAPPLMPKQDPIPVTKPVRVPEPVRELPSELIPDILKPRVEPPPVEVKPDLPKPAAPKPAPVIEPAKPVVDQPKPQRVEPVKPVEIKPAEMPKPVEAQPQKVKPATEPAKKETPQPVRKETSTPIRPQPEPQRANLVKKEPIGSPVIDRPKPDFRHLPEIKPPPVEQPLPVTKPVTPQPKPQFQPAPARPVVVPATGLTSPAVMTDTVVAAMAADQVAGALNQQPEPSLNPEPNLSPEPRPESKPDPKPETKPAPLKEEVKVTEEERIPIKDKYGYGSSKQIEMIRKREEEKRSLDKASDRKKEKTSKKIRGAVKLIDQTIKGGYLCYNPDDDTFYYMEVEEQMQIRQGDVDIDG